MPKIDPVAAILDGALGDPVKLAAGHGAGLMTTRPRTGEMFPETKPEQMDLADPAIDRRKHGEALAVLANARGIAARERFLHWQAAFPGVWDSWESLEPTGGFDAVIGNPPWDRIKLQEVEWFASRRPEVAKQQRASDRARMIAALKKAGDPLYLDYQRAAEAAEAMARVAREQGSYPLLSGGDINLYSLFVERAQALIQPKGLVGLLVPSGIAADKGASDFFGQIASNGRLVALLDFENRRSRYGLDPFFPDVDSRFKFCAFVTGGKDRHVAETACAFFLQDPSEILDPQRCFPMSAADFARLNPNTKTAPILRTRRDAEILRGIYGRLPVLHDHAKGDKGKVWPIQYFTMFHMTNDARLFRTRAELDGEGVYPVAGGRLRKGSREYLPLYEGKMVQSFDHRAASIAVNSKNLNRPAQTAPATDTQHADPAWSPTPQFWVDADKIDWPSGVKWAIGFKDVTSPTNVRTMIAALVPRSAIGNTLPLVVPDESKPGAKYSAEAPLFLANLNAFAFDFVARQKVQGQHVNWFVVEQLPVVSAAGYSGKMGGRNIVDVVREEVLALTYASEDMQPFAEDMGFSGEPFRWDEEDRRHRRARLDAIFFRLYELGEDDAAYILDTFPIVREEDEKAFGLYRTKEMILAYMRAFAAGDTSSRVAV